MPNVLYFLANIVFDTAENDSEVKFARPNRAQSLAQVRRHLRRLRRQRARPVLGVDQERPRTGRRGRRGRRSRRRLGCCIARDRASFTGLVLGCIEAKFCKKICV